MKKRSKTVSASARRATKKSAKRSQARKPVSKTAKTSATSPRFKIVTANARREGTKAAKRFSAMAAYLKRHPKATKKEVNAETPYHAADYRYDLAHGFIKEVA